MLDSNRARFTAAGMKSCIFVAYCFLISGTSLAIELRFSDTGVQKLASDVERAVSTILGDFEQLVASGSSQNDSTYPNKWMAAFLGGQTDDDEQLNSATMAKIATINDVILTAELLSLADGFHLIIPAGEEEAEHERRVNALAIISMLMNLSTMERVDAILADSSLRSTVTLFFNGTNNESLALDNQTNVVEDLVESGERIGELFAHWLQSIETLFENEPRLNAEFEARKKDSRDFLRLKPPVVPIEPVLNASFQGWAAEAEEKLALKMARSDFFHWATLNRVFLRQASKHVEGLAGEDRKHFLLARALIELATHHGEQDRLNDLYQKSLGEVGGTISSTDAGEGMRDKLFTHLESMIAEDADLRERVSMIERKFDLWINFRSLRRNQALI